MNSKEWELRKDLCEASYRLYVAGFMAGSDGNLSTILNDNEILITPSRISKGHIEPWQIVKIDRKGNRISGDLPATTEAILHLTAYEERPDICSVVHCHAPVMVAFSVAGISLPSNILPEIEVIFGGQIPLVPYATPGGKELAESIRPYIREKGTSVILLDHHGLVGVGQDIYQAAIKIEHAESAAKIILYSRMLGGEKPLPPGSLDKLHAVHSRIKDMEAEVFPGYCHTNGSCTPIPGGSTTTPSIKKQSNFSNDDIEFIVRSVVERLMSER